ncbi:hypothetical protein Cni_G01934 [Canna indica]|uniref:Uncharacterized protein n=1 Tax=Canna indica TaxID=4628 RepID=A0AAQ3JQF2_9LILI|nr:hypothetical protein Cni_G01934 [Canna indica]
MENHKKTPVRVRCRVTAKKWGCDTGPSSASAAGKRRKQWDCINSVRKFQRREIGGLPRMARAGASVAAENPEHPAPGAFLVAPLPDLFAPLEIRVSLVRNSEFTEDSTTEFVIPSAFIFLYENHLFLTFRNKTIAVWNFRGDLVTSFEYHLRWHLDYKTNNIYTTSDQDIIISYCKAEEGYVDEGEVFAVGSINMSNILTRKCIVQISGSDAAVQICPRRRGETGRSSIRSTVREALEDVTALFYDEDRNEICTGNKQEF